jgi:hypothetical protein
MRLQTRGNRDSGAESWATDHVLSENMAKLYVLENRNKHRHHIQVRKPRLHMANVNQNSIQNPSFYSPIRMN